MARGKPISITHDGEELLAVASRMFGDMDSVISKCRKSSKRQSGGVPHAPSRLTAPQGENSNVEHANIADNAHWADSVNEPENECEHARNRSAKSTTIITALQHGSRQRVEPGSAAATAVPLQSRRAAGRGFPWSSGRLLSPGGRGLIADQTIDRGLSWTWQPTHKRSEQAMPRTTPLRQPERRMRL